MSDTRYTSEHEWVRVEDGIGTVGISDYAQQQLGDVVFVELPEVGRKLAKGDEAAVVESVKAASEVYSPVSGEVVEVNETLNDQPGLVNEQPENDGWFFRIRLDDEGEVATLMDEETYRQYLKDLE